MINAPFTGLTEWDIVIRLVLITVLAGMIGLDREYAHKPAGIRTNVMVGLGSTLFTLASIRAVDLFASPTVPMDPTRIAAQIVTGIGFLGVGTILINKDKERVIGLTTAATLWVVAGLGIAVGMGLYLEALVTTAMIFFTFLILTPIVDKVRNKRNINLSRGKEDISEK